MDRLDRIERGFERWGHFVFRHRWMAILLTGLVTGILMFGMARLRVDASMESLLSKEHTCRLAYDQFRAQFGNDEQLLLVVRSKNPFTFQSLEQLRNLHEDLEESLPHVESVSSLINARLTYGTERELIVGELLEEWPESEAELDLVRQRALSNPLYRNLYLSADEHYTAVTIKATSPTAGDFGAPERLDEDLDSNSTAGEIRALDFPELDELIMALDRVIGRHSREDFSIWVTGGLLMEHVMVRLIQTDMGAFTVIAVAGIGVLLMLLFRRVSGVAIPLVVVILSLIGVIGFMGLADLPITPVSQIFPSLLLAIGVGGAVHLLAIFFPLFDEGMGKEEAMANALAHSGLPIVMTSVTTAGSLASFFFAELSPVADFGIEAPSGVLLALVYCMGLLPALVAVVPLRRRVRSVECRESRLDRLLAWVGAFSSGHPWSVICVWGVLVVTAGISACQLRLLHSPVEWIPSEHPFRQATDLVNKQFKAAMNLEVLIDSGVEKGLYDPRLLKAIERAQRSIESLEVDGVEVGKTIALPDVIKEIHRALNGDGETFYSIPNNSKLVAQELLLFEISGSDAIEELVDSQFRAARMQVLVTSGNMGRYRILADRVAEVFEETLGDRAEFSMTGITILSVNTMTALLHSVIRSYIIALAVIVPFMILLLRSLKQGLMSMLPNLAPIVVGMAFMYWVGFPMDVFASLIGSIAIGVAVDDTIHFMHGFNRAYERSGNAQKAVRETLLSTGRALLITSAALVCGFLPFAFATMGNVVNFGLVAAFTIAVAFVADVNLSPALLVLLTRFEERRRAASLEVPVILTPSQLRDRGIDEEWPRPTRPQERQPSKSLH